MQSWLLASVLGPALAQAQTGPSDYPHATAQAGAVGTVSVNFVTDQNGSLLACSVVKSSGAPALDEKACSELRLIELPKAASTRGLQSASKIHYIIPGKQLSFAIFPISHDDSWSNIGVVFDAAFEKAWHNHGRSEIKKFRPPVRLPSSIDGKYPNGARRGGKTGLALAINMINQFGVPNQCDLVSTSGSVDLDKATCAYALKLRYSPALDPSGSPIGGVDMVRIQWNNPYNR